jgi:hypothetical protein
MNANYITLTAEKFELLQQISASGVSIFLLEIKPDCFRAIETITFDPLVESSTAPINYTTIVGYDITNYVNAYMPNVHNAKEIVNSYNSSKDQSKFLKVKYKISNLHKWMLVSTE